MGNFGTLVPKEVVSVFTGHTIQGFSDGTMIEVEQVNNDYEEKVGIDLVSRVQSYDGLYIVRFTLQQVSKSNTVLERKRIAGLLAPFTVGILKIDDLQGDTK